MPRSGGAFDIDGKRARLREIDAEAQKPGFWDQNRTAQALLKEKSQAEALVTRFEKDEGALQDAVVMLDLADEAAASSGSEAESMRQEAAQAAAQSTRAVEGLELSLMLSGPNDHAAAIVTINAGAGGTESCDWAQMLLRMLTRYAERKGYELEVTDVQPGDEAGIKSADFIARGENAFGYLKAEAGVHRLVRISPFDSAARRHTSFASVFVTPELEDDIEVEIDEADIRIDTFRASGAGGQKVNKTSSAVRITHFPTGLVVSCQNERSQHQNRARAMAILANKLAERAREERQAELDQLSGDRSDNAWGSQIRSYVLAPYQLVKDLRTNVETGNVDLVLDGDIDGFIEAELRRRRAAP